MKKLFISLLAVSFIALNVNAQTRRDVTQSQKIQSDSSHHFKRGKMMTDLNLTAEQKSQMKEIQQSNKEQRDAIRKDVSLTPEQKKAKMKDLLKSQSDKVNSILTPEQQAKRKASIEKMRSNGKMHGKKGYNRASKNADSNKASSQQ